MKRVAWEWNVQSLTLMTLSKYFAPILLLPLLAFSGCSSTDTSSSTVSSIDLSPSPCVVTKSNSNQLTATATFPNGQKKDITTAAGVVWTSANTQTITITSTGNIVGVSTGVTEIAVTYQGAKSSMSCSVP